MSTLAGPRDFKANKRVSGSTAVGRPTRGPEEQESSLDRAQRDREMKRKNERGDRKKEKDDKMVVELKRIAKTAWGEQEEPRSETE